MHVSEWRGIAALLFVFCGWSCGTSGPTALNSNVSSFEFGGTDLNRGGVVSRSPGDIGEAAVKLAHAVKVPICFEPVAEGMENTPFPIEIKAEDRTVGGILDAMVRQDPRYEYRERLGVIELRPVGAADDPKSCLNMTIPVFRIQYPWTIAIGSLRCQVKNVSDSSFNLVWDPMRGGCAGRLPGLRVENAKLIRATFLFERVRDILDRIVAESGEAAWTAYYTKPSRTCDSLVISAYAFRE